MNSATTEINVKPRGPSIANVLCLSPWSRSPMLKYIIPTIRSADLWPMIHIAVIGGLIGGAYGILHDQITYTISPEYFSNLKFQQFHYADFGLGNRVFASTIGFLATWWVGLIVGWLLARRLIRINFDERPTSRFAMALPASSFLAFRSACLVTCTDFGEAPEADYSSWDSVFQQFSVTQHWSFVRVAYIHNAGYFGGLIGLIVALVAIRPGQAKITPEINHSTEP